MDSAAAQSPSELYSAIVGFKAPPTPRSSRRRISASPATWLRPAVAADRARVAPRRAELDRRHDPHRARRRGRAADRRSTASRPDAGLQRLRRAVQTARDPVPEGTRSTTPGSAARTPAFAVPAATSPGSRRRTWRRSSASSSRAGGDGDGKNGKQPTGPGLHGTGLNATSYGNVDPAARLQPADLRQAGQPFSVAFTNQGDNDEFNVKVTLKIARESGGSPITLNKTVAEGRQGREGDGRPPAQPRAAAGHGVTITSTSPPCPGERKTDNNKASYPSLFEQG